MFYLCSLLGFMVNFLWLSAYSWSLIHFELIFVCGVRKCPNLTFYMYQELSTFPSTLAGQLRGAQAKELSI